MDFVFIYFRMTQSQMLSEPLCTFLKKKFKTVSYVKTVSNTKKREENECVHYFLPVCVCVVSKKKTCQSPHEWALERERKKVRLICESDMTRKMAADAFFTTL